MREVGGREKRSEGGRYGGKEGGGRGRLGEKEGGGWRRHPLATLSISFYYYHFALCKLILL